MFLGTELDPRRSDKEIGMLAQLQSSRRRVVAMSPTSMDGALKATPSWERLVRVGLALYLLPALLAVVFVSVVGMLLLVMGRRITDIVGSQACHPRTSFGPEAFRV